MKTLMFCTLTTMIVLSGCNNFDTPQTNHVQHITTEISTYFDDSNIEGKIDYPLLDIEFDKNYSWTVIIRNEFADGKTENVWVSQNTNLLNKNMEYIRLLTFPVGRGTTPSGYVYIYKDNELVKSVPYIEIEFGIESIKEIFFKWTSDELENELNISLPSFI